MMRTSEMSGRDGGNAPSGIVMRLAILYACEEAELGFASGALRREAAPPVHTIGMPRRLEGNGCRRSQRETELRIAGPGCRWRSTRNAGSVSARPQAAQTARDVPRT